MKHKHCKSQNPIKSMPKPKRMMRSILFFDILPAVAIGLCIALYYAN